MKLWEAGATSVDDAVLAFTVGDDPQLDRELLPFDCLASAAHARMLASIGVVNEAERDALITALAVAYTRACAGDFEITVAQEDGHTALEEFLTEHAGDAGKKIHTGRSRNDQVIAALRLLARDRLLALAGDVEALATALISLADQHRTALMPGYTHTRLAMPSTVGQLLAAAAESLTRDLGAFHPALEIASRSALGSASGYGVPLPLDRELVAELLGLEGVDVNTIHVQNSRGRLEAAVLFACHQLTLTCSRLAADLIGFSSEAFGFFRLPDQLTTGSSIMPNKRNPDVLELVRAVPASMLARYTEVTGLLHGLPAGYHRDLQRTKEPMLRGLVETRGVLRIMTHAIERLEVDEQRCRDAMKDEIFATDLVYAHVRDGVPFREAYRQVKHDGATVIADGEVLKARTHLGAPGTDYADALAAALTEQRTRFETHVRGAETARALLGD